MLIKSTPAVDCYAHPLSIKAVLDLPGAGTGLSMFLLSTVPVFLCSKFGEDETDVYQERAQHLGGPVAQLRHDEASKGIIVDTVQQVL